LNLDLSLYVWGINGTLVHIASGNSTAETFQNFTGDFFVGYQAYAGAPLSNIETVLTGTFTLVFNYLPGRTPTEQILTTGSIIQITPQFSQPVGFFYPLIFGSLNQYTITQMSNGALSLYGSKLWCTCPIDSCNICGGDGSSCQPAISATSKPSNSGLSRYDIAAIVVGVVGGVFGILLVALFSYHFWRRGRERRSVRDDTDLAGPDKPDYGTMAINEVLADHGRPLL